MTNNKPVILILAAGMASRMGCVKQLLSYHGKSLLQRSIENAQATGLSVIVVLGAYINQIRPLVESYGVMYVINKQWRKGISTSIHAGVNWALEHKPDLNGIIITLPDQPYITSAHLSSILEATENNADIIATEYQGVSGVPAYFSRKYLEELKKLKGDTGARALIKNWPGSVFSISFPAAALDIDTEQDWKDFIERRNEH